MNAQMESWTRSAEKLRAALLAQGVSVETIEGPDSAYTAVTTLVRRIDNALALCREAQAESTDGGVTDVDTLAPSAIVAALTGQDPT